MFSRTTYDKTFVTAHTGHGVALFVRGAARGRGLREEGRVAEGREVVGEGRVAEGRQGMGRQGRQGVAVLSGLARRDVHPLQL